MKILNCASLYLDGALLWVFAAMFLMLIFAFVIVGLSYLQAERRSDRLEYKNRKLRADLCAAKLELNSARLKGFIREGEKRNV